MLRVEVTKTAPDTWLLNGVLSAEASMKGNSLRGKLTVRFAKQDFLPLQIPVLAEVQPAN